MAFNPEFFSELHQTSLLYLDSITEKDPYYLIPFVSACMTFSSIRFARKKQGNTALQSPHIIRAMNVFQYMPFAAIAILGSFPAVLNMYWCSVAMTNLGFTIMLHSTLFKKFKGVYHPIPGTILHNEMMKKESKKNIQTATFEPNVDGNSANTVRVFKSKPKKK
jgi:membrane protein insertase Oxa1/YidC/SpoIIIJ